MKILKIKLSVLLLIFSVLLTGCTENQAIVNNIDERDANEILVLLASKGIIATKVKAVSSSPGGAGQASSLFNIAVTSENTLQSMSILNQNGLPRRKGTSLLELFGKQGLMSSDKEEKIRFQAGLEEELKNTIRKIDGVLDVDVQISFPSAEATLGEASQPKIKAAVYVKHQGLLNDQNNHIESKIKRLISGSVESLDFENVTVILDQSKMSDIKLGHDGEPISPKMKDKEYVSIWSMVMTKSSSNTFRTIFFTLVIIIIALGGIIGLLIYKFYPLLQKKK